MICEHCQCEKHSSNRIPNYVLSYAALFMIAVSICFAYNWVVGSYIRAKAYREIAGVQVSTWDLMWSTNESGYKRSGLWVPWGDEREYRDPWEKKKK